LKIPPGANAAHLCVDVQRLFSSEGPWPLAWMERVLPKVAKLVEHAPTRTIFTRFLTPESAEDMPGQWRVYYSKWSNVTRQRLDSRLLNLMPELERHIPPAAVFDKFVYSAFASSELREFLRRNSVDTLIVSGSETDVCVLSTMLAAIDHGYRIVMARDAVCSSSDASHDAIIGLFHRRFHVQVEVAEVAEILDAWRPA
jgi:nicotinamidase-related amidase